MGEQPNYFDEVINLIREITICMYGALQKEKESMTNLGTLIYYPFVLFIYIFFTFLVIVSVSFFAIILYIFLNMDLIICKIKNKIYK
jgi:hypothetical protein